MYIHTYFIKCWTLLEDFSLLYFKMFILIKTKLNMNISAIDYIKHEHKATEISPE